MKRLDIFILKSFIGPFVLTFFISTFILLMQFLWRYIEDLVGKGLDIWVLSKLLMYISITLIPMALPLAILLASIMTFGNLGENYELTAIKSAGISLQRIMLSLIIFNLFISIGAFFFSNQIIPYSNLKMRSLLYDIQRQKPELQIKEGTFYNGIEGYNLKIGRKDIKTGKLYDFKIYNHTENRGNVAVTIADSGYMKMTEDKSNLIITMMSGYNYYELKEERLNNKRRYPHRKDKFGKQELILDLSGFGLHRTDENLFRNSYKMLNLEQLKLQEDSLRVEINTKKNEFFQNLIRSNYLKTIMNTDTLKRNISLVNNDTIKTFDKTTYYQSLTQEKKKMIINQALYDARRMKDFVYFTSTILVSIEKSLVKYTIEWHRKFTLSFACFIFFFIGAPLGAIIRKGGFGMPIVISILFFIFYYIITLTGEKFVKELYIHPWEGMWVPSFILLPLGIFLTYKATHDSTILNIDTYFNYIKEIPFIKRFSNKFGK